MKAPVAVRVFEAEAAEPEASSPSLFAIPRGVGSHTVDAQVELTSLNVESFRLLGRGASCVFFPQTSTSREHSAFCCSIQSIVSCTFWSLPQFHLQLAAGPPVHLQTQIRVLVPKMRQLRVEHKRPGGLGPHFAADHDFFFLVAIPFFSTTSR